MDLSILAHAAFETAKISWPTVIEARRGRLRPEDCDERLRSWARRLLERVDARVSVRGLENVANQAGPFVVVSNHESQYDIPALFVSLPLSLRMAAKKELFRTPLWGPALRASGFVEIDRKSPGDAHRALERAGEQMRATGVSLFIAPEGTRSVTGELGRFKKGAFVLSMATALPVLPVALLGTRAIHRKGARRVTRGCAVTVSVLPPLVPADFLEPEQMAHAARAVIERELLHAKESGR